MSNSLLLRRRLLLENKKIELLPCVESTHSSYTYINTGIKASNKIKVELDFKPTVALTENSHLGLFGSRANDGISKEFILAYRKDGQFRADRNAGQQFLFGQIDTNRHKFVMDNTKVYFDDSLLKTLVNNAFTGYDMYLGTFNTYNVGVNKSLGCRYYSFKIWENSLLVRDFRPAKNNNVYGFYDLVEKKFYPSLAEPFKPCSNLAEELGYVKNGLVCFYDAQFNSIEGHKLDTATLQNLINPGTYDLTYNSGLENLYDNEQNGVVFPGQPSANISVPAFTTLDNAEEVSYELVLRATDITNTQRILFLQNNIELFYRNGLNYSLRFDGTAKSYIYSNAPTNVLSTMAGTFKSSDSKKCYLNGVLRNTTAANAASQTAVTGSIGSGQNRYPLTNGSVFYCFRVYNRQLSNNELLQNYNIDKERFGG